MSAPKTETKNLEEVKQDCDRWLLFVLQLIYANRAERNRILDSMKPENAKRTAGRPKSIKPEKVQRPVGRPKKHTPESDAEFLREFERRKTELSKKFGDVTDDVVLALPQLLALQDEGRTRLTIVKSGDYKKQRKTQKNRLALARNPESRKLK